MYSKIFLATLVIFVAGVSTPCVHAQDMKTDSEKIGELQKDFQKLTDNLAAAFSGVKTDNDNLLKEIKTAQDKFESTKTAVDQFQESLKKINLTLDDLSKSVNLSLTDLKMLEKRVADLESKSGSNTEGELERNKQIANLKNLQQSMVDLQKSFDALESKMNQKLSLYPPQQDSSKNTDLLDRLAQLENQIANMQANSERTSSSSPISRNGRIVVINETSEEVLFLLNGASQRVSANASLTLENQTPGNFSYEIISPTFGTLRTNSPTLVAGETFRISIR